nr:low molecular weight phosphatase family protein [Mycolicibacterium vanbaalenii]
MHVMFVCTGNICRSPMAERLAAAYGGELEIPDLRTSSAGVRAVIAHPIHQDAVPALESLGGDASDFSARQLTARIAAEADLILTMTREHREAVLGVAPRKLRRTFTLIEAARIASRFDAQNVGDLADFRPHLGALELPDIPDPIGRSPDVFAAVGAQIAELLPPIMELLRRSIGPTVESPTWST